MDFDPTIATAKMRPVDGSPGSFRLTRKADADARTRLITSIYLPEEESGVLAAVLQGDRPARSDIGCTPRPAC